MSPPEEGCKCRNGSNCKILVFFHYIDKTNTKSHALAHSPLSHAIVPRSLTSRADRLHASVCVIASHGRRVASSGPCLSVPSPSPSRCASMVGHAEDAHDVRHLDHLLGRRRSLEVAQPVVHVDVVDETCGEHAMIGPAPQARHACSASRCEGVERCSVRICRKTPACWQPGMIR